MDIRLSPALTDFQVLEVEVVAPAAVDVAAPIIGLFHRSRRVALELLQEAVDLVLDARRRMGHCAGEKSSPKWPTSMHMRGAH